MSTFNKHLRHLIEEEISKVLREQDLATDEPAPAAPEAAPAAPDLAAGAAPAGETPGAPAAPGGPTGTTGTTPVGGAAPAAPGVPGAEGDAAAVPGAEGEVPGELGDAAAGGGPPSLGGGGFDFGNSGEAGLTPEDEEEEKTAMSIGPEDVEMPDDPVMAIADEAINMLKTTRQPNLILKAVKSSIQKYFSNVDDATPVIKALWDSEDLVLRDVARRLLLFIRGI